MIELRCSRDLALRLGAIVPETVERHRVLVRRSEYMLVRDRETGWAMFWPMVPPHINLNGVIGRLLGKSS